MPECFRDKPGTNEWRSASKPRHSIYILCFILFILLGRWETNGVSSNFWAIMVEIES